MEEPDDEAMRVVNILNNFLQVHPDEMQRLFGVRTNLRDELGHLWKLIRGRETREDFYRNRMTALTIINRILGMRDDGEGRIAVVIDVESGRVLRFDLNPR